AGSAVLLLALGRRLFGRAVGLHAALVYATSLLFVLAGRLLLTDSSLVFFSVAGLLGLATSLDGATGAGTALGGVAFGPASLAKGPIAGLPLLGFAIGFAAARPDRLRAVAIKLGSILAVGCVASLPWLVLAAHATGGELPRRLLLDENLRRFLHPME